MIKQMCLVLIGVTMAFSAATAPITQKFTQGTEYVKVDPVANQPRVLEFFSFYCPHCYDFEYTYQINKEIKESLPEGITLTKYHVDFMGPLGKELTKAWAIAVSLGVEDKVSPLIFTGIQKTNSITSADDIRATFIKAGVKAEEYDAATNSFMVNALVIKQQKAAEDMQLKGVPAIFVDGKYMIRNEGLNVTDAREYGNKFSQIINYLIDLK